MLTTTTYSKLREVLDGTDTQVATCAIDRWTAKMKRTEGYIAKDFSRRGGRQFRRRKEVLLVSIRRGEEEIILGRGPRTSLNLPPNHAVDDLIPRRSRSTVKASSQRPSSQARFSTKFIVLSLLGLGLLTSTVKGAPQIGTLQLAPSVGRTYVLVRAIVGHGGIRPSRSRPPLA